jgi:hypothetical protein
MVYSPRQVVVRAQEAAIELLRTLHRERLVEGFLHSYAKEFGRPGRAAHPARHGDLLEIIRREALLAMVARIHMMLPGRLGFGARGRLRPAQERARQQTLELFREEFFASLGRALEWEGEEFESFRHDLSLYERLSTAEGRPPKTRKLAATVAGPFVDRVGLVLDPAMLEKARGAAARFQSQLDAAADRTLRSVFSSRRSN